MSNVEHTTDHQQQKSPDAAEVTAPACPSWCNRPDLPTQRHRDEWDFDEDDGHESRNHYRMFGEHVALIAWETSAAPRVMQNPHIEVRADELERLRYGDAIRLAAALTEAAAALDGMGAGR